MSSDEPSPVLAAFGAFFDTLEHQSVGLTIEELRAKHVRAVLASPAEARRKKAMFIRILERRLGFSFAPHDDFWLYLVGARSRWSEGTLMGGFDVEPLGQFAAERPRVSRESEQFWGRSALEFDQQPGWRAWLDDPGELRWFTGTTAPSSSTSSHSYGCVAPGQGTLPSSYHYYDSGKLYALPFQTPLAYFEAMLGSGAVECWQYFHIEPDVIIAKNEGLPYITWNLQFRSQLWEPAHALRYDPSVPYDRLDLIVEYLERCVRLLPLSFPTLDFSHHRDHFAALEANYLAIRSERRAT